MHISLWSSGFLLLVPAATAQLNIWARASGKLYFGSATDNYELSDKPYKAQLSNTHDFAQITPFATEPTRGKFNFTGGDEIVKFAKKNQQLVRGHTCVWHSQLPDWVEAGNFSKAELNSIVHNHCHALVKHHKEPFNEDGTFRETVFYNTIGISYISTALRAARAADPKAKLYINDYNLEGLSPKSTGMVNLVKQLKKDRVPIDGIGVQGHLIVGSLPTTIRENLQAFADLGVEVAITELDIRMPTPPTAALLEQQKKDYQTVIAACKAVKKCIGVTIWDWTDKARVFEGEGAALPWDENLVKKPAYYGIIDGWRN
uniref:Beta-xylanase n=1 Tax=Psilocybe cubensis TaxID=181762 RepID=A0A8H7Y2N7_PSICU